MMGTPVPPSAPGRVGSHSAATPVTPAISTAARSSDTDGHLDSIASRESAARGDHSRGNDGDDPGSDNYDFDNATPSHSSSTNSGLVDRLVGGVLN
jgi:hypothetical protein